VNPALESFTLFLKLNEFFGSCLRAPIEEHSLISN
jgi:hypothetical protein